jgi:hypothetical protein
MIWRYYFLQPFLMEYLFILFFTNLPVFIYFYLDKILISRPYDFDKVNEYFIALLTGYTFLFTCLNC